MGATSSLPINEKTDLRQLVQTEHPQLLFQDAIGFGRMMKTIRTRYNPRDASGGLAPGESSIAVEGRVTVKIFLQRGEKTAESRARMAAAREQLAQLCRLISLRDQPNLLPYQRWGESARFEVAYLLRQHVMYNMYDRLNSRPFPSATEKLWYVFQVLRAVAQAHARGIRHGDIKAENVLVTSWGWVLLTDFALFKPTFLPEDSPADFNFFFESSNSERKRSSCCNLAPERLVRARSLAEAAAVGAAASAAEDSAAPAAAAAAAPPPAAALLCDPYLRESMDLFSTGCTIAEIVLDGLPFFEQATLLKYKLGGVAAGGGVGEGGSSSSSSSVGAAAAAVASSALTGSAAELSGTALLPPPPSPLLTASSPGPSAPSSAPPAAAVDFDPFAALPPENFSDMDPTGALRSLVAHMVQRAPSRRLSAATYLDVYTALPPASSSSCAAGASAGASASSAGGGPGPCPSPTPAAGSKPLFPAYFPTLASFFSYLLQPQFASPDSRIIACAALYPLLIASVTGGCCDPAGEALMRHRVALEGGRGKPFRDSVAELVETFSALGAETGGSGTAAARAWRSGSGGSSSTVLSPSSNSTPFGQFSVGAQRAASVAAETAWEWGWSSRGWAGGEDAWEGAAAAQSSTMFSPSASFWREEFGEVEDARARAGMREAFLGSSAEGAVAGQQYDLSGPHRKWEPYVWVTRGQAAGGGGG